MDLKNVRQHMANRDFIGQVSASDERWRGVYMALADDVPDLVAEVERLELQNGEYRKELESTAKWLEQQDSVGAVRVADAIRYRMVEIAGCVEKRVCGSTSNTTVKFHCELPEGHQGSHKAFSKSPPDAEMTWK